MQLEITIKSSFCQTERKYFSCFEILHFDECKGLFRKIPINIGYNNAIPKNSVFKRKGTYMINFSHPIYSALRNAFGCKNTL